MALLASFFGRNTNFLEEMGKILGLRPQIITHFFREICITSSEGGQQWSIMLLLLYNPADRAE